MPLSQWTESPLCRTYLTEHWLHLIHPWELHHILVCDGYHNLLKYGGDASRRGEIDHSRREMKGVLAKGDIGCLNALQTQEKTFTQVFDDLVTNPLYWRSDEGVRCLSVLKSLYISHLISPTLLLSVQ